MWYPVPIWSGASSGWTMIPHFPKPALEPQALLFPDSLAGLTSGQTNWPLASDRTVLVVEDDPHARRFIKTTLRKAGFQVMEAESAEEALPLFDCQPARVALLDIGLPGMDGFELCRKIRERGEEVAILILTGRGSDADRVFGLNLGADDYLVKPFSPEVLVASIKAVLRRCLRQAPASDTIILGDLKLEFRTMKVWKGDREVDLTPREFSLLVALLGQPRASARRARR